MELLEAEGEATRRSTAKSLHDDDSDEDAVVFVGSSASPTTRSR